MSTITRRGRLAFRTFDPLRDAELLHGWVTDPGASFRTMRNARLQDVERAYMAVAASEHRHAWLGLHDGLPAFLMETYDPRYTEPGGPYVPEPGDIGVRLLVAPPHASSYGFARAVVAAVLERLFADPGTARVVVDQDVQDTVAEALDESVGFAPVREIRTAERRNLLSLCTHERYAAAPRPRRAA
ncbi:GNAT family N-acetyltransferase [Streptomyces sp. NPDC090306]|uniref:GNAT family N-acetyltransferase n=1 Tax=Streptomyces sp. NPDC090306 TaxID=3365961 RepID=UPI0038185BDE